jgi:copper chaperone CopZ
MATITLRIPGMTCRHCVRSVTSALRDVAGVESIEANATTGTVVLAGSMQQADVLDGLEWCGFPGDVVQ